MDIPQRGPCIYIHKNDILVSLLLAFEFRLKLNVLSTSVIDINPHIAELGKKILMTLCSRPNHFVNMLSTSQRAKYISKRTLA